MHFVIKKRFVANFSKNIIIIVLFTIVNVNNKKKRYKNNDFLNEI